MLLGFIPRWFDATGTLQQLASLCIPEEGQTLESLRCFRVASHWWTASRTIQQKVCIPSGEGNVVCRLSFPSEFLALSEPYALLLLPVGPPYLLPRYTGLRNDPGRCIDSGDLSTADWLCD